jgi:hypothetical protein
MARVLHLLTRWRMRQLVRLLRPTLFAICSLWFADAFRSWLRRGWAVIHRASTNKKSRTKVSSSVLKKEGKQRKIKKFFGARVIFP